MFDAWSDPKECLVVLCIFKKIHTRFLSFYLLVKYGSSLPITLKPQDCWFLFHCGHDLFIFIICNLLSAACSPPEPMKAKSSMIFLRVIRYIYIQIVLISIESHFTRLIIPPPPPRNEVRGYTGITMSVCPSVRPSVRPSVCPSVRPSVRPHLGFRRITAFPLHLSS